MAAGHRRSAWALDAAGGATVSWLTNRAWSGFRFTANGKCRIWYRVRACQPVSLWLGEERDVGREVARGVRTSPKGLGANWRS